MKLAQAEELMISILSAEEIALEQHARTSVIVSKLMHQLQSE